MKLKKMQRRRESPEKSEIAINSPQNTKIVKLSLRIRRYLNRNQDKTHAQIITRVMRIIIRTINILWSSINRFNSLKHIREQSITYNTHKDRLLSLGINDQQAKWILHMFSPEHYRAYINLPKDNKKTLEHYIRNGLNNNIPPSPLFNFEYYRSKAETLSLPEIGTNDPFTHWLKHGVSKRVVPTPLFNEQYYLWKYPKLKHSRMWAFEHYIFHGIIENRSPNPLFSPQWYKHHYSVKSNLPLFIHYLVEGFRLKYRPSPSFPVMGSPSPMQPPLETVLLKKNEETTFKGLSTRPIIQELVNRAGEIEPSIISKNSYRAINIPPYNKPTFPLVKTARKDLKRNQYDIIILVPHCRMGGASLVSGTFTRSISDIFPENNILLVRTDLSVFERPDWFPDKLDTVDLPYYVHDLTEPDAIMVLLDILIGLNPRIVININSKLGWTMLKEYSSQLDEIMDLYGYYFCYDINKIGQKVGYPISTFSDTHHHLNGYFVDNSYLKDFLAKHYSLSKVDKEKIHIIYTPTQESVLSAEKQKYTPNTKRRNHIAFWAGRFDRQKRFDIVIQIAKKMKHIEFWVWGKAVLDGPLDISTLPANIIYQGTFDHFDDLPFDMCSFWLYTSQWDGLPTTLIEIGQRGIPIVGSRVGGTGDILNEDTAWPVDDILSPNAYISKIYDFLGSADLAAKKTNKMKELIQNRHNTQAFSQRLLDIMEQTHNER